MTRVLPGGQTILSSTPWAEAGLLYEHAPTLLLRNVAFTREIVAAETARNPKADRHRPRRNIKIPHADMDKVTRWEAAAKRRGLSLTSFLVLAAELLAGCAVPLEPTAEDVARGDEPAQQAPRANFCLAETYARDLCGPDMAPSVCNGTTECTLVEVIPMRDEQATPLPNQESIYWRRFPPGPRYVYCCE